MLFTTFVTSLHDQVTFVYNTTTNVKAVGGGGDITCSPGKIWVVSTNTQRPIQVINASTNKVETIYSQTPNAGKPFKVDGAARVSDNFVWLSGYHSKTIWIFKK
jgi:hypothetical protein